MCKTIDSDQSLSSDTDDLNSSSNDPMYGNSDKKKASNGKVTYIKSMKRWINCLQYLPQIVGYIPVCGHWKTLVCPCSNWAGNNILYQWMPYQKDEEDRRDTD